MTAALRTQGFGTVGLLVVKELSCTVLSLMTASAACERVAQAFVVRLWLPLLTCKAGCVDYVRVVE